MNHASPTGEPVGLASFDAVHSYTATMTTRRPFDRRIAAVSGPIALLLAVLAACERPTDSESSVPAPSGGSTVAESASPATTVAAPAEPSAPTTSEDDNRLEVMAGSVPFRIAPATVDFGAVDPGSINESVFTITNRGDRAVRVVRATPSCVCTTLTDLTGVSIEPGASVELRASLDAPTVPGEKDAKVFIVLEGMEQPAIVTLVGMVTLPVQPTPAYADALKGVNQGVIGLASPDGRPFRVIASNGGPPAFVGPGAEGPSRSSHAVRWSIEGMSPDSIPKWWIFSTDRDDCPLVACRVRNENTGSRRDASRFDRRWIAKDDFITLGRLRIGEPVEVPIRLTHYNPRGAGAIDKPDWSRVLGARSADARVEASLVSATVDGPDAVDLVVRLVPNGPAEPLLYVPIEIETATGAGEVEIAAMVSEG